MSKSILVTGAAGFIGFHAALALKKRGDRVVGLDNFNDYYDPSLKRRRAEILKEHGIDVVEADINSRDVLENLFSVHAFTHLLHLAAQAGVRYARENPESYLKSNIDGFLAILETLRHHPKTDLVYASSSSVYGTNVKVPFSVTDRTDHPANLYAATKKSNELMAYCYHHLYGNRMRGLRFFTVYGPWGRPDMALFSFTEAISRGKPIHLFNNGEMERDFTYIDDVVAGTLAAIDCDEEYDVYNLGSHEPAPLLTFVSLIEKELGKAAIKVFEGESSGEVKTTCADISDAQEKLGYAPKTSLEEGIRHFINWYQEYA
ncbi:MAG: UDP-N-acetylglucosamine 4-epimerase [Chlamydiae bacterium]|nr:UDP-N-acetylglucosamine 4-epimerase [Chlamydiota bacterium]